MALEIEENQKMMALPFENEYRWIACAGVAVITLTALCDFTSFGIDTYKRNKSLLLEKWNIHKKYHQAGGVCEMSLLYLWQKARRQQYKILNLGIARGDIQPCIVACASGKSYEINKNFYGNFSRGKTYSGRPKCNLCYGIIKNRVSKIKIYSSRDRIAGRVSYVL